MWIDDVRFKENWGYVDLHPFEIKLKGNILIMITEVCWNDNRITKFIEFNFCLKRTWIYFQPYALQNPGCNRTRTCDWPQSSAQVSFSDRLLSVVCLSVCKLFTFSTSSPEQRGQFEPNLSQSILGWRGFKFVQMKGHNLLQGEIITK